MRGTEEQLAWEQTWRPRVGIVSVLAAILTVAGGASTLATFQGQPRQNLLESAGRAAESGPLGSQPSLKVPLLEWYDDNFGQLLLGSLLSMGGAVAAGLVLTFLALATYARKSDFAAVFLWLGLIGGALYGLGSVLITIGNDQVVADVLGGPRTVDAVADLQGAGLSTVGQGILLVGTLAFATAFALTSLRAMRVGLLTRFMGVLGIIAGMLVVIPLGGPLPVVQIFWLLAIGVLLLGRWPGGLTPAWRTGQAEPWPSAAELRAAREGAAQPQPAAADPQPAPKKRKRRR